MNSSSSRYDKNQYLPLIEKLRPDTIDELYLPEKTRAILTDLLSPHKIPSFPHLLLQGPPGTGKTSTARLIARTLLNQTLTQFNYLELNASSQRGVDQVRDRIQNFVANRSFMNVLETNKRRTIFFFRFS